MSIVFCTPMRTVNINVLVDDKVTTIQRTEPVTWEWHRARQRLMMPSNAFWGELEVIGLDVDVARNTAAAKCLESKQPVEFIFFLDNDVLPPPPTLTRLYYQARQHPECDIFFGVYCTKSDPPEPLIYGGDDSGALWDWTVGDVLIDGIGFVGMGCTLIRTSLLAKMEHTEETPWFKTVDVTEYTDGNVVRLQGTEDAWFCRRAVAELGAKILVDTSILCGHINNQTGTIYGLPDDSLPARRMRERQDAQ